MMKNIIIFLGVSLFFGCHNNSNTFLPDVDPNDLPFYEMDEEFKRFFNPAGEGSSYIYIDTLTGEIDTMTITSLSLNYGAYTNNGYTGEGYNIGYECTKTQSFRTKLRTYTEDVEHQIIFPFGSGFTIIKSEDGYLANGVSFETNFTLLDQTYGEVLTVRDDGNSFYEQLWFAKDVGIILKETKSGEVYLLKTFQLK